MLKNMFAESVYAKTTLIPKGKVSTYKEIAKAIGKPKSSRAVGNALNKNPYAPQVSCHRVIKSNGEVGGFANGGKRKIEILNKEGVLVANGKIDLKKYLYEFKDKR